MMQNNNDDGIKTISHQQTRVAAEHPSYGAEQSDETAAYQSALPKEYLMELLDQNKWVNNFVIDAYLELLTKKNPNFGYVPTYVVTYFRKDGIIIPNWFQSITLEHMPKIEYWLIPAHINNNHWALAVFGVSINFMTFYDSLYTGIEMEEKNKFKENILKFFKMLYHEKNMGDMPFDVNITGWLDISNVPKQENEIDCGVFLMMFADDIVNQKTILPVMTVSQEKIYECRMKIFNELAAERSKSYELLEMIQNQDHPVSALQQLRTLETIESMEIQKSHQNLPGIRKLEKKISVIPSASLNPIGSNIKSPMNSLQARNNSTTINAAKKKKNGKMTQICEFCEKPFKRKLQLERHIRTHTGEKPYKCNEPGCKKSFSGKSNCWSHEQIHKFREKKYECNEPGCGKKFITQLICRRHENMRHNRMPKKYVCEKHGCGKSFLYPSQLNIHEQSHKSEEKEDDDNNELMN